MPVREYVVRVEFDAADGEDFEERLESLLDRVPGAPDGGYNVHWRRQEVPGADLATIKALQAARASIGEQLRSEERRLGPFLAPVRPAYQTPYRDRSLDASYGFRHGPDGFHLTCGPAIIASGTPGPGNLIARRARRLSVEANLAATLQTALQRVEKQVRAIDQGDDSDQCIDGIQTIVAAALFEAREADP